MARWPLGLTLAAALAVPASAGKLDLDPFAVGPDATMTLAQGIIIPGAGHLYLAGNGGTAGDVLRGLGYLALTAAAVAVGANGASRGDTFAVVAGFGATIGLRFGDLTSSVTRANELRSVNLKRLRDSTP